MKSSIPWTLGRRRLGVLYSSSPASPYSSSFQFQFQASVLRRPSRCSLRHNSSATASLKHEHPASTQNSCSTQNEAPEQDTITNSSSASISEHVRLLMRQVPYPVAIITATDPSGPPDTTSFRGMTVSSFNTVTLTPHPVISFNVRRPSETLNALLASGRFLVHLLASGPATATLATDFSKGNATLAPMLNGHGEFEFVELTSSSGSQTPSNASQRPLPILRRRHKGNDSVRAQEGLEVSNADFPVIFECKIHPQKIDVQDHSIILGTVVRAIQGPNADLVDRQCVGKDTNGHLSDRLCLTYANTKFWKMGTEI